MGEEKRKGEERMWGEDEAKILRVGKRGEFWGCLFFKFYSIPNMISGAAQADCALLVINATRGEFETGFDFGGQTREHAMLIRSLGVSQLAVAVNKMDTVGWAKERFEEVQVKLRTFLKQTGYPDPIFVPCSGINGENLVEPVPDGHPLKQWYKGPTLLQVIGN